jgi:hypothetical protein
MKIDWQYIIVGILFASAIYFIYKSIRKSSQGHSCAGGCKCEPGKAKVS